MDLNITLTIGVSEQLINLLQGLEITSVPIEDEPSKEKPSKEKPLKEEPLEEEPSKEKPPLTTMPADFTNDAAKRAWLIDQLEKRGVEIPPRTRTNTLEDKWNELTSSTPSKAEITKVVQAFINKAESLDEKKVRQDKVRGLLKEHGAKNISELAEDKRQVVIDALG